MTESDPPRTPPRAMVFDIERFALHDGPGIRTTVFLKGCPLRCLWCHNPESLSPQFDLSFTPERCIGCGVCLETCPRGVHRIASGRHTLDRERCQLCGDCADRCAAGALELIGRPMAVDDVVVEVLRDAPFYKRSGGGVTVSGGEPMVHYEFTLSLLSRIRSRGVHTALDTSGYCPWECLAELEPHVSLFLYDLKHVDPHRHLALTGVSNELVLDNLQRLDEVAGEIWVRIPLIPGQNDEKSAYHALGRFLSGLDHVTRVEILRCHRLAESKYERIGQAYRLQGLEPPDSALAEARREILLDYGLQEVVWR
jgi:pyruvate formate lyase activating enzyme